MSNKLPIAYGKCNKPQKRLVINKIRRIYPNVNLRDIISGEYFACATGSQITHVCFKLSEDITRVVKFL